MPEISEAQQAIYTKAVSLLDRMISDPKEGLTTKRRIKELMPEAKFPELDIVANATDPLIAEIDESKKANKLLAERLDAWEKNQKDHKEESELQSQLDGIKKQYGFTVDGMQKVLDRMKAKSNPDAESAAAWVAAQERKAAPVKDGYSASNLNLFGSNEADESWKALNLNPEKWGVNEMEKMLAEYEREAA